ncbi:MAG: hypothetical protein JO079_00540, partial [Frankiaceae bacterium]|nr:hypothetical protein [Frankiaceae bacterium]
FTVDTSTLPDEPVQPGSTVQLPVTFTPAAAGLARGTLRLHVETATDDPEDTTVVVNLDGYGKPAGLVATPAAIDVGQAALEVPTTEGVELRNPSNGPVSLTALNATGGFAILGAPTLPATIPAGGALAIRVTVIPTASGPLAGQLTATADGIDTAVPLTGTATSALGRLRLDATSVPAGTVAAGKSVAVAVRFTNWGLGPLTVTQASMTGGDFTASADFGVGVQVQPAQTVVETLTFTPRLPGPQTGVFRFLTTAGGRPGSVTISGYGSGPLPRLDASSWRPAGTATIKTHVAVLNPLVRNVAGSVVYNRLVHTAGLHATYQAYVGGGTGGSGLTFAILGSGNGPGSVGSSGPGMGVGGLGVVAVTLDTEKDGGDPSNHFVGVAVGFAHGRLTYVARAPVGPGLRVGWHTVDVRASGGYLLVSLDGRALLRTKVTLPAQAWLGFTGATGPGYEWNEVKSAVVTVG